MYKVFLTFCIWFSGIMVCCHLKAADIVFNKDNVYSISSLLKNDAYFRQGAQQIEETGKDENNRS